MIGFTAIKTGIGAAIRQRRLSIGMTQTELARSAGVVFQQVGNYEIGRNSVSIPRLVQMATALGTTAGDIINQALVIDKKISPEILEAHNLIKLYKSLDKDMQVSVFTWMRLIAPRETREKKYKQ